MPCPARVSVDKFYHFIMWALRSASNLVKNRTSSYEILSLCHVRSKTALDFFDGSNLCFHLNKFFDSNSIIPDHLFWNHTFSSESGLITSGEEDYSKPYSWKKNSSGNFAMSSESLLKKKAVHANLLESELFKTITGTSADSLNCVLDNWIKVGKIISRQEGRAIIYLLRKFLFFAKALQFSEWLEKSKTVIFAKFDYADRVYLIGMVRGIEEAELYMNSITTRWGEIVYRHLLGICVSLCNTKKAEEIFNKMKDLKLTITIFSFNKLLSLYMKFDREKIPDLLRQMDEANLKLTSATYRILIEAKGRDKNYTGMEKMYEKMKTEGLESNMDILSVLLKYYTFGGLTQKASVILKEIEGSSGIDTSCRVSRTVLPFYAALGKADEIEKFWKSRQPNPFPNDYIAAIEAWGKLKNFKEAEALFDEVIAKSQPYSTTCYALMRVYANHNELARAKSLIKTLMDKDLCIHSSCWDLLAKLYLDAGELEKADLALHKAVSNAKGRPWFTWHFVPLMDGYAKRGDVHNCERIFQKSKNFGHRASAKHFMILLDAYGNSGTPPYGFMERMLAENLYVSHDLQRWFELGDTTSADLNLLD